MRFRLYGLITLSVIAIAVCIRLGIWQLSRLHERRVYNASVSARLIEAPVSIQNVPRDTGSLRFRRVHVEGVYDFEHEIVLTNRMRNGSPGVNILTPLRIPGTDTALLINRGWVYAADGTHADLAKWREKDTLVGEGYALLPGTPRAGSARATSTSNAYRWIDFSLIHETIPYPLFPYMVVLESDSVIRQNVPPRVSPPALDEGPHLSYAFQWFSFAVIFGVGAIIFLRTFRTRSS